MDVTKDGKIHIGVPVLIFHLSSLVTLYLDSRRGNGCRCMAGVARLANDEMKEARYSGAKELVRE